MIINKGAVLALPALALAHDSAGAGAECWHMLGSEVSKTAAGEE
jgi:hypothetical protein